MSVAGRRERLSADECRERLIEVGLAALAETGLTIGLDAVTLDQAVRDAGVPRSSSYAAWSTDPDRTPQQVFQRAVLTEAISMRRQTVEAFRARVAEYMAHPPEGLIGRALFRELIRVGGEFNLRMAFDSQDWRLVFAMRSIANTGAAEERDSELLAWLSSNELEMRTETIEEFYKPMAKSFEIEPRPEYGEQAWHLIEIAHSALLEGLSMRSSLDANRFLYGLAHSDEPEGGDGWSIYALLFEHFVGTFFEFEEERKAS